MWASVWVHFRAGHQQGVVQGGQRPGQTPGHRHHPWDMRHPDSRVSGQFRAEGLMRRPAGSWAAPDPHAVWGWMSSFW